MLPVSALCTGNVSQDVSISRPRQQAKTVRLNLRIGNYENVYSGTYKNCEFEKGTHRVGGNEYKGEFQGNRLWKGEMRVSVWNKGDSHMDVYRGHVIDFVPFGRWEIRFSKGRFKGFLGYFPSGLKKNTAPPRFPCPEKQDPIFQYRPEGEGKLYDLEDNLVFEGTFRRGHRHQGKFFFTDRSYYIGDFDKGIFNGKGKIYDPKNKLVFDGRFRQGKRQKGKSFLKEGWYHIGKFENKMFNGNGAHFDSRNTLRFKGIFKDNERYSGRVFDANGIQVFEGKYKDWVGLAKNKKNGKSRGKKKRNGVLGKRKRKDLSVTSNLPENQPPRKKQKTTRF